MLLGSRTSAAWLSLSELGAVIFTDFPTTWFELTVYTTPVKYTLLVMTTAFHNKSVNTTGMVLIIVQGSPCFSQAASGSFLSGQPTVFHGLLMQPMQQSLHG